MMSKLMQKHTETKR